MKVVWKYAVPVTGYDVLVTLPKDARIVHVGSQSIDTVMMWCISEEVWATPEKRIFRVFGTGHEIPDDYSYIGTALPIDELVWHLFERIEEPSA